MLETNTALLRTKLFVVRPQANLVRRERAAELMDSLPERKLTLISAPPGFGKTTLVSAWLARSGYPAAWVSLDAGDNDPLTFFTYLIAAVRELLPGVGTTAAEALRTSPMPRIESVLGLLINDLLGVQDGFVVVFDDYHVIENPVIHEGLLFLLEHSPEQFHCAITTRVDPPLRLARFRVRRQLLEVRAADLRFSVEETGLFFNERMGMALNEESLERLQQKTEGWIAGLQMAALSLRDHEDVEGFIEAFTGADRYIIDFLLEEVIRRQPEEIQQAMVQLSILDRFTAPLCETVTGHPDGVALLDLLERSNMFLISLDNHREWYRYHHLFGDLLRHRLKGDPERVAELHHRAACWFNEHGLMHEALHHAGKSGDIELLVSMLEQHWCNLSAEPRALIGTHMAPIPQERIGASTRLLVLMAWDDAIAGRMDEADTKVRKALELFEASGGLPNEAESREIRGQIATLHGLSARDRSDSDNVIKFIEEALSLIPERAPIDPGYGWITSHGMFYSLLGDAYYARGQVQQALTMYERGVAFGKRMSDHRTTYVSTANIGRQQIRLGLLDEAYASFLETEAIVAATAGLITPPALINELKAEVLYEQYRLDEAEQEARIAWGLAQHRPLTVIQTNHLLFDIAVLRGDWNRAEELISESDGVAIPGYASRFQSVVDQMHATFDIHRGEREKVMAWMERYFGPDAGKLAPRNYFMRMMERLLQIQALVAFEEYERAESLLAVMRQEVVERGLVFYHLRVLAFEAVLAALRDDEGAAVDHLEQMLEMAAPARCIAPFVEQRDILARLLVVYRRRTRRRGGAREQFLAAVCAACGVDAPFEAAPEERGGGEIIPLTNRELEILGLMGQGLSNRQMADKLYVSLNTIKTHVGNLMDKLETSNRVEALIRARELGMLE